MILSADSDFHCRARRLYFTDMKAVIAQSKGRKRQRHSLGTGVVATRVILDEAAEIGARRQPGRVPPGRGRVVGNGHEGPGQSVGKQEEVDSQDDGQEMTRPRTSQEVQSREPTTSAAADERVAALKVGA